MDENNVLQIWTDIRAPGYNLAPSVAIDWPGDGEVLSNTIVVRGTASDDHSVLSVVYAIDNDEGRIANGIFPWRFTWDTRYAENGRHRISVRAYDGEKFSHEAVVNVLVRNDESTKVLPLVTIDEPLDGAEVSDNIIFTGRAWGPNAVASVKLFFLGTTLNCSLADTTWKATLDTRILADGTWEFSAMAFDGLFWSQPATINLTVQNEVTVPNAPPWVIIQSPSDGQSVSGIITARGTADDPERRLTLVLVRLDDGEWVAASALYEWTFEIDTWKLANGDHRLSAMCTDDELISPVVEVGFTILNDLDHPYGRPRCLVGSPGNGSLVNGTVTVVGTADDDEEVVEVLVSVAGGGPSRAVGTGIWSFGLDTSTLPNGPVGLRIWASDGVRDSDVLEWTLVVMNDRPPSCLIGWPVGNQTLVGDAATVTGSASDPDGTSVTVEVQIDGGDWVRCEGGAEWAFVWNLTDVEDGNHTVRARAFDGRLYSPTFEVEVRVMHPAEPTTPHVTREYVWWPVVLAIIAVVVAVAASSYAVMRARRGQ